MEDLGTGDEIPQLFLVGMQTRKSITAEAEADLLYYTLWMPLW